MKTLIKLLIVPILGTSCSSEQRLARLIKKHPELVSKDTIFKRDTTIVNGVEHDTVFKSGITRDTVIIKDHQLTIKYFNDGKTTYIKGKCDTVFVVKEIPIQINSVQPKVLTRKEKIKIWMVDNIGNTLLVLGLIFLLLKYLKRFFPSIGKFM